MSYTRRFNKRIAVHYSGTVSYPPSQSGGTKSFSGTAYEDVTININVDTNDFDYSIGECNEKVDGLTGAVVATETAQVVAINNNAKKIGKTIIDGFFKTVQSEISQQVMELSVNIDSLLIHLKELSKRCLEKQKQMEIDYNRISQRYLKIFEDLNKELENRIYELDKPAFTVKRISDKNTSRITGDTSFGTVAVSGMENSILEARIGASIVKRNALSAINKATKFLDCQKETDAVIANNILPDNSEGTYYSPVCYVETHSENEIIDRKVYATESVAPGYVDRLKRYIDYTTLENCDKENMEKINRDFNNEVSKHFTSSDTHSNRVRDYITQLFNNNFK